MASQKATEECANNLHKNSQRIVDFVHMTSSHNFLATSVAGSSGSLELYGAEIRGRLGCFQSLIIKEAFAIMKTLLPALRLLNNSKESPQSSDLQKALELQWVDFTLCLEMFGSDVKVLWFLNNAYNTAGDSLDWSGIKTGFHSLPNIECSDCDVEDKPVNSRMEDAIRKTELILHSLKTQMAVQAWAVEHFSSFAIGSVRAVDGETMGIKFILLKLRHGYPHLFVVTSASIAIIVVALLVVATFLF
uniref:Uncharacterized LOC100184666 n=1 Tax=Ciona intestinalis TaxID=7719 RepID=F6XWL1_CIOIN|nr:uncharacterized protein LOC100184666 [Ciona intestinalis]|eukprot:XP_002126583.1 uncharacterized protein LOC100184666 [Ciona intestinalis]